jgi:hypothetical protein
MNEQIVHDDAYADAAFLRILSWQTMQEHADEQAAIETAL